MERVFEPLVVAARERRLRACQRPPARAEASTVGRESAIEAVSASILSARALFSNRNQKTKLFSWKKSTDITIPKQAFNSVRGTWSRFSFEGRTVCLPPTTCAVRVQLVGKRALFFYQPDVAHVMACSQTRRDLKAAQTYRLPGGLRADVENRRYTIEQHTRNETPSVAAIDPGVRTFATLLHAQGRQFQLLETNGKGT